MRLSELLITNNDVLLVNKELAKAVGLNESIVLSQIQYWINIKENDPARYEDSFHDGRCWVYNSIQKWNEQFPFWSVDTVKRSFSSLKKKGILITANYNKKSFDKTNWYAIDYEALDSIEIGSIKLHSSIGAKCTNGSSKMHQPIPKTTTETTNKDYIYDSKERYGCSSEATPPFSGKEKKEPYIGTKYNIEYIQEIVEENIRPIYREVSSDNIYENEFIDIVITFFVEYHRKFGKNHPFYKKETWKKLIKSYLTLPEEIDNIKLFESCEYRVFIDKYFRTEYPTRNVNYQFAHFITGDVKTNLYYELRREGYEPCYKL